MAEQPASPAAPLARPAKLPWWRRALGVLGLARGPETLEEQLRGAAWSDDAQDVVRHVDRGGGVLDALAEATELASFFDAVEAANDGAANRGPVRDVMRGGSPQAGRAVRVAKLSALGAGRSEVRSGDVLYALLRLDQRVEGLLAGAGLTRGRLATFLSHGVLAHPRITGGPRGDVLELVLHNDDFTPQEVVVELLEEAFGLHRDEAVARMLEVHTVGASIVASLPRAEALASANRVLDEMRGRGYPLLVTLESFEVE